MELSLIHCHPPSKGRRIMKMAFAFITVLFLSTGSVLAQELAGYIEGAVADQTGAVIPGANVVATHISTNAMYRATTSATGTFAIPKVRLGLYNVAVESPGFRRAVVRGVNVEVGGTASLRITLQAGMIQEEVEISASFAQEIVNTTDAELSTVVDERRVLELPLNGRNASQLALLQAGAYYEQTPTGEGNKLFIHGQRHRSINISLDGIDTQDNLLRASSIMINQPLLALAAENVQEFRVITGVSSAEFSRGGAQISAVTRSGSNDFNGSVFWFHRNTIFNANNFFNNSAGVERAPLIRNQFGGRIGGPIWKDRTFFFFGYQQTRQSLGIPVNRTVYTADARRGIFGYLDNLLTTPENVARNPDLIRRVNMVECGGQVPGVLGRDCVDDRFNAAMPSTLDPFITGTVFGAIPLPNNFDVGDGLNTGGFRFNSSSKTVEHLPSFRLDHKFNDQHSFYATFNYLDRDIQGDFINERETIYPDLGPLGLRTTLSKGYSAGLNSTFTPTVINEFRFGYLGGENAFPRRQPFGTPFTLDLNDISDPYEPGGGESRRDNVTLHLRDTMTWIHGNHQVKFGGEFRHRWVNNYSFFEDVPELDFGRTDNAPGFSEADLRALSGGTDIESADYNNARDQMNNVVGAIGEIEIRYNVASLTSGFVPGIPERRIFQNREFDWFIQDTWRVRPNFTLNLGVRWEYASVPIETQGLALVPEGGFDSVFGISGSGGFFNPGTFNGRPCDQLGQLPLPATTANVTDLITGCAVQYVPGGANNGLPFFEDDYNNFGPVIGFAWDPFGNGKTSVRAGFRISYMQDHFGIIDGNLDDNEGLTIDQDCVPADGNCISNETLLRNIIPGIARAPVPPFNLPTTRTILDSTAQDFRTYVKDLATPYYQEWTLSLSRELFADTAVELRYVGNRGVKLRRVADYNEINVFAFDPVSGMTFLDSFRLAQQNLACNRANGSGDRFDTLGHPCSMANPLMDALIAGEASRVRGLSALIDALDFNSTGEFVYRLTQRDTSRPASGQSRIRGGSFWGAVLQGRFPANFFQANPFIHSSRALANDGFSTYHSLEVEVRRRFSGGFTLQANYTFGKALADFDGDANELLNDVRPSSVRNPRYSIQQFMPRHQFNANWIYELPFGPGKPLGTDTSGFWGQLIGGWQFGGIVTWRSGRPISIVSGVGSFHRSAISDENTVGLSQAMNTKEIRDLVGRRTIAGSVFWFDPCLSDQLGSACADSRGIPGLFTLPDPGRLGDLPQTPIYGPRRFVFDFSFSKRTKITEGSDVEFRWEVFNAFNNTNFNIPSVDIFSPSFGQVLSTITDPRLMQFALKINF